MAPHPWSLEADRETRIPIVHITGEMTLDLFRKFLDIIADTPLYRDSDRCLWDLRSVTDFLPTMAIRYLAASIREKPTSPRKTAIVVERDVHFGLARMFTIRCEQPGVTRRVFRDYELARNWLVATDYPTEPDPVWQTLQYASVSLQE